MKIISNQEQFNIDEPTAVAIGKFDGIHKGHELILDTVLEADEASVVFTFDPSPQEFFSGEKIKQLTTREEKREAFARLGVDYLIELPLNSRTASISPEDFIKTYLVGFMKAKLIVAGEDLSFGDKGRGDFDLLNRYSQIYGYRTQKVEKVRYDGDVISSSRVRKHIASGDVKYAKELLGSPYSIEGTVIHGKHLGSTIGFPTVNLAIPDNKLVPSFGVYFTNVVIGDRTLRGITNIGRKPTVNDTDTVNAETYIYDFDEDVYGENIKVELLKFHRSEMKFGSVEALKAQLAEDVQAGRGCY